MTNGNKGKLVGIGGLIALLASWAAVWVTPHILAPKSVPQVWLAASVIVLPCATAAGVFAARKSSSWWYVLAAACFLSVAFLLSAVAV